MGLKVASQVIVRRKVIVREPSGGTAFKEHALQLDFLILKNSEEDALYRATFVAPLRTDFVAEEDYRRALSDHDANQRGYARQLLTKVIHGWPEKDSGIEDGQGNPLLFSAENLAELLELPYAVTALVKGYREAVEGKGGAKGN